MSALVGPGLVDLIRPGAADCGSPRPGAGRDGGRSHRTIAAIQPPARSGML